MIKTSTICLTDSSVHGDSDGGGGDDGDHDDAAAAAASSASSSAPAEPAVASEPVAPTGTKPLGKEQVKTAGISKENKASGDNNLFTCCFEFLT